MNIGDHIPEVLGTDSNGQIVTSDDFEGRKLIVYFYPKDNTPGCTAEACSLRDGYQRLRDAGYVIIGISKDSPESHRKFAAKNNLPFPLLSDESTDVNRQWGVWQKKKMAGREYMGTVRTTFVTDEDHLITHIITKVNTKDAAGQLLQLLGLE
ncbi:MAG: thioredoxin-dependent thiol peroxidase [Lachnoclostridium sp.]|nr:thioredoxin-dependent thiol peroxidase [Lachnoclostridium sp.]